VSELSWEFDGVVGNREDGIAIFNEKKLRRIG